MLCCSQFFLLAYVTDRRRIEKLLAYRLTADRSTSEPMMVST